MNPFAAVAVKTVGAVGVAALLSAGAVSAFASSSSPSPTAGAHQKVADNRADRRLIRRTIFEAEADVLHLTTGQLRADLVHGQTVEQLAKAQGMDKTQFAARLAANLKPRLESLVDRKQITQAQADKVLDRIAKGYVPFWNGIHTHKK